VPTPHHELELLPGHIRVGDAERAGVAERLSGHAAAGRLTVAELEQRLDLAHGAVIVSDLRALEADLALPPRRPAALPWPPLMAVAVALLVAGVAGSIAAGFPIPPLFIGAFLVWRLATWRRGRWTFYARAASR
jgi:DUF1707 SHOCT-like domain